MRYGRGIERAKPFQHPFFLRGKAAQECFFGADAPKPPCSVTITYCDYDLGVSLYKEKEIVVALVESVALEMGQIMPDFELATPDAKRYTQKALMGKKGLLVVFTCNHCPYALAIWPRLIRFAAWAEEEGVATVAINPNIHPNYPEDSPDRMREKIHQWGILFPYLVDETQSVARAYQAQCTPDIYLLDGEGRLFYHGRLDDNWKSEADVSRKELQMAVHALIEGEPSLTTQYATMGCAIKWQS